MKKKKIKIKDVIENETGIFSNMDYTFPNMDNSDMDVLFMSNFGEKLVSPLVETFIDNETGLIPENNMIRLSKIILSKYKWMWDKRVKVLNTEYELDSTNEKIITEVVENKGERSTFTTTKDNEAAKIYGFGGDDAANDNSREQTTERSLGDISEDGKSRVYTEKGNGTSIQSVLGSELKMSQWDFIQQCLNDVSTETTLSIY